MPGNKCLHDHSRQQHSHLRVNVRRESSAPDGNGASLFISDEILQETLCVLRDKFGLSHERVAQAEQYTSTCSERVKTGSRINVIKEDPDDNRVLECAEAAGCEFIITGDLDLLRLGKYGNIRIMTVRAFLDQATK